ncbi:MAG: hypothetical protein QOH48_244, partial [Actinomycetota bacterium]|nr:hypothetical protein [Actinomycetota bacterium]
MRNARVLAMAGLTMASLLLAACSGNSGGGSSASIGSLVVGAFNPFSGPDASFGPEMMAGCIPAANTINKQGGVL